MMTEISLNILDVAQNSVSAGASLIEISVIADTESDMMSVTVKDDGCGMAEEQLSKVTDPFFTTRTTRNIGLGVPFFKMSAESTGGRFKIESEKGRGTCVTAEFILSSIDRMPLGDITGTVHTLIVFNADIDFIYCYSVDGRSFRLDTREFREILGGGIPFSEPEVSAYIRDYLTENKETADEGIIL